MEILGYDKVFIKDFRSIINSSLFDFSKDELEALLEALECTLRQVPTTDFYGIYQHDDEYFLMYLKNDNSIIVDLGYSYDYYYIENIIAKL